MAPMITISGDTKYCSSLQDFPECLASLFCNYYTQGLIMSQSTSFAVEEHVHGETVWVAVRSRGADWSWLTPDEAVELGRSFIQKYSALPQPAE
jgi:hypothetical protein